MLDAISCALLPNTKAFDLRMSECFNFLKRGYQGCIYGVYEGAFCICLKSLCDTNYMALAF